MSNRNFAKIRDGGASLELAPAMIWPNPNPPTAEEYAAVGYLPVVYAPPSEPAPDGYHWEPKGWEERDGAISRVYESVPDPTPSPRTFSKLRLYAALAQAGLWDAVEAWLKTQTVDGVNAYVAFSLAQDLTSDHPLFGSWLEAAKAALGVDDETAERILSAAEVTAP